MPLFHGKSKADFAHNVKTEMDSGKPQKQSLAIAYSLKRKGKAHGGMCAHGGMMGDCPHCMAEGGSVDNYESGDYSNDQEHNDMSVHQGEMAEYDAMEFNKKHPMHENEMAMEEDDLVSRAMKSRANMYSKGGEVANADEIEAGFLPNEFDDLHLRDDLESSYTGENSGENSGDMISDAQEDEDRRNMVSRIMRMRKMKAGRNPNPA